LSKEEVERMKAEAKANESADKAEREKVDKINQADSLLFQTEKQLKEYGDKIPADKKAVIEQAAEKLKEAHQSQDLVAIDAQLTALNTAWTAASEDMYKATQGNPQGAAPQPEAGSQAAEDVTDVPFEEVK